MRFKTATCFTVYLLAVPIVTTSFPASVADQTVTGWVEDVVVVPENFRLRAKIDTGARHSSLNAMNPVLTEVDGKTTVKFEVTNRDGENLTIEKPVHRIASVKRHTGISQKRPVIRLTLCLGGVQREVEVNLIDRSELNYQLLVGRSFLSEKFLVDSGKTDLLKGACQN